MERIPTADKWLMTHVNNRPAGWDSKCDACWWYERDGRCPKNAHRVFTEQCDQFQPQMA